MRKPYYLTNCCTLLCCTTRPCQDTQVHTEPPKYAALCQFSLQFHSTQQNVFINISLMVDICVHARAQTYTRILTVVSVLCTISRFSVQCSPVYLFGPWACTRICSIQLYLICPFRTYFIW